MLMPILLLLGHAYGQLQSQNDTFNSTFRLTPQQIKAANLSATTVQNVEFALSYERSNNAVRTPRISATATVDELLSCPNPRAVTLRRRPLRCPILHVPHVDGSRLMVYREA